MKNVYFLSDAHLGSLAIEHGRTKERKLANFLDSIKHRAQAVYLMGDLFDFWHEYRYVVPKGYTRLLGKISELTDAGVEVHYFCGNHDLWQHDYFERECGMVLHRHNEVVEIGDKTFFLGHGDGLNRQERGFKLLRALFHNRLCQTLFAAVGGGDAVDDANKGRFARTVGAEQSEHLAAGHADAHIVEGGVGSVALDGMAHFKKGIFHNVDACVALRGVTDRFRPR